VQDSLASALELLLALLVRVGLFGMKPQLTMCMRYNWKSNIKNSLASAFELLLTFLVLDERLQVPRAV